MARAICTVEGRAGSDPELKTSRSGDSYVRLGVAVTERVKDGDQWADGETTWYNVTAWKSLADTVADTIRKGDLVLVTGRFKMDEWTGDDGIPRSSPSIAADSIGLVRKKNSSRIPF